MHEYAGTNSGYSELYDKVLPLWNVYKILYLLCNYLKHDWNNNFDVFHNKFKNGG